MYLLQALEKSKYEQSLESVRRFIAIAEKELELYYRHVALYGDPNDRDPKSVMDRPMAKDGPTNNTISPTTGESLNCLSAAATTGFVDQELSEYEDEKSSGDLDYEDDGMLSEDLVSSDESTDDNPFFMQGGASMHSGSPFDYQCK